MSKKIYLQERNIVLEFPDEATDEMIQGAIRRDYPMTGEEVAGHMMLDPEWFANDLTLDEYKSYRKWKGEQSQSVGEFLSGVGGAFAQIGGEVVGALGEAVTSPALVTDLPDAFAVGTKDIWSLAKMIQGHFTEEEDTYDDHLDTFIGRKDTPERRADYDRKLATDMSREQEKINYFALQREKMIKGEIPIPTLWGTAEFQAQNPTFVRGAANILDPSVFFGGFLGKAFTKAAAKASAQTVGKAVTRIGKMTSGAGDILADVAERGAAMTGRAVEGATGLTPQTARGLAYGTGVGGGVMAAGAPVVAGAIGGVKALQLGGRVLAEAGEGLQRGIGREGFFGGAAARLETGSGAQRLATGLSYLDFPLELGARTAGGAVVGGAVGMTLGGLADGWEGAAHGLGGGMALGGIAGGLVRGVEGLTGSALRVKRATDVRAYMKALPEGQRDLLQQYIDKHGTDRAAMILDISNYFRGHLLDAEVIFINQPKLTKRGWVSPVSETGGKPTITVNLGKAGSDYSIAHELWHGMTKIEQLQPQAAAIRQEIGGMWIKGEQVAEGLVPVAQMETFYKDYVKALKPDENPNKVTRQEKVEYIVDEMAAEQMARLITGGRGRSKFDVMLKAFDSPTRRMIDRLVLRESRGAVSRAIEKLSDMGITPGKSVLFPDLAKASPVINALMRDMVRARKGLGEDGKPELIKATDYNMYSAIRKQDFKHHQAELERLGLLKDDGKGGRKMKDDKDIAADERASDAVIRDILTRGDPEGLRIETETKEDGTVVEVVRGSRFSPDQISEIQANTTILPSVRENVAAFNNALEHGLIVDMTYYAATKRVKSRLTGLFTSKYNSGIKVSDRKILPYKIEVTDAGNFVLRAIDYSRMWVDTAEMAIGKKLGLWDNNHAEFLREFGEYLENLSADDPQASAKMFGREKADFMHDLMARKEKGGSKYARTFRFDRMDGLDTTTEGSRIKMSEQAWDRSKARLMPDVEDPFPPGHRNIGKHLTPEEKAGMRSNTAHRVAEVFNELPADKEFLAAAKMGEVKRGWYARAAVALKSLFGADTDQFVGLLAATSPRQSVTLNLRMSLDVWREWLAAGRPTEAKKIKAVLKKVGGASMGGRQPNAIRALQGGKLKDLSGYKVESFRRNLLNDLSASTNDAWMAAFGGVDQAIFGTKAGYLAYTAKVRRVAKKLGWEPAEVQETVWSFFQTLYENQTGGKRATETINKMTDFDVAKSDEFANLLLNDARITDKLKRLGIDYKSRLSDEAIRAGVEPEAGPITARAGRGSKAAVGRIARRASTLKEKRLAAAEAKKAAATSTRHMPDIEAAYGKAVESGDTAAQQSLVDKAAKSAGYTIGPFYHGSDAKGITSYQTQSGYEWGPASYWTPEPSRAAMYGEHVQSAYLKIEKPLAHSINGPDGAPLFDSLKGVTNNEKNAEARRLGYDGVINMWGDGSVVEAAAFDPKNIKSADPITRDNAGNVIPLSERFDPSSKDIRFMPDVGGQDALGMFSAAERATVNLKQEKGTASQMLAMIKKGGVKDEELQVLGLDKFLEGNRRVTKSEIIDHLVENSITVEEVVLGEPHPYKAKLDSLRLRDEELNRLQFDRTSPESVDPHSQQFRDIVAERESIQQEVIRIAEVAPEPTNPTKHSDPRYQEPGAVEGSYRELLLKLPGRKKPYAVNEPADYRGGHYGDTPNVLAHVRFNDRVSEHGKTLHHEEFQSDWHQTGRTKGYHDPVAEAARKAKVAEAKAPLLAERDGVYKRIEAHRKEHGPVAKQVAKLEAELDALNQKIVTPTTRIGDIPEHLIEVSRRIWADKEFAKQYHADNAELGRRVVRLQEGINRARRKGEADHKYLLDNDPAYGHLNRERLQLSDRIAEVHRQYSPPKDTVPDAPFKTSWHELAMKRMIKYGVDNNYDALSWTKGETQAARYDLSKQVDEIWYDKHKDGTFSFDVKSNDTTIMDHHRVGPDVVEANIGKDMLRRMDARKGDNVLSGTWRILKGEDLKVGGEFHKLLYDSKLVHMKTWKKLGLKVESADLGKLTPEQKEFAEIDKLGKYDNPQTLADRLQANRYWELHGLLGREGRLQAVDPKTNPVHLVRLTPEVKAKVLDGGLARFMPDSGAPNTSRNALGWSLIESKAGKWHVYRPDGTLAGIGGSKRSAESIFKTHYKRELRKQESR